MITRFGAPKVTLATLNTRTGPKPPVAPREWICYHNPDEMNYAADDADPHAVETGKRLNPLKMIGDRIWLVGRNAGTTRYYLHGYLVVDSYVERRVRKVSVPGRNIILRGSHALQFRRRVRIDREAWFRLYKDEMNQLSLGLQSVKRSEVLKGLFTMVDKHPLAVV